MVFRNFNKLDIKVNKNLMHILKKFKFNKSEYSV